LWCDPVLDIKWPIVDQPKLAAKDAAAKPFAEAEYFD